MAILEKGTAYKPPLRKGAGLRDFGKGMLNLVTSPLNTLGIDVYNPTMETPGGEQFENIGGALGKIAGDVGLGLATSGLSSMFQPSEIKKYGGTIYGKKGKKYFALGGTLDTPITTNPVPNKAIVIKSKVPKVINGEPTVNMVDHYDTLVGQDYGSWGENLQGVNVPAALPTNPDGSINFKAIKKVSHYKEGGLLTEYEGNTHENGGIPISETDEVEDKENSFDMKDGNKYIFSNSIIIPDKKHTFAQGAKRIANKYKLRDGDAMAKVAQQRELEQLSQKQEFTKEMMKTPEQRMMEQLQQQPQQFDEGGYLNTMFRNGGRIQHGGTGSSVVFPQQKIEVPANDYWIPEVTFGELYNNNITPMKSKGFSTTNKLQQIDVLKSRPGIDKKDTSTNNGYKPAYGVPMVGYAAQALSNLPALFNKPAKVNFQRVNPETIDLSPQREEARRMRNLQIAMSQKQAGQMDNAGQAGAYANAAVSGILGDYGNSFNQSIGAEKTANVGIRNQAQAQNAQIQMQEQIARQQETDAIRSGKQQAIMNMGQALAGAGQTYQQMGQEGSYLNAMSVANPDYGLEFLGGNFWTPQTINPYRKHKCGGKIRRKA